MRTARFLDISGKGRKGFAMITKFDAAQASQLNYLRIFLLICCLGVSAGGTVLAVVPLVLLNPSSDNLTVRIFGIPLSNLPLPIPAIVILTFSILIGCASVVCLAVYFIVRSRFEKDEAPSLDGDIDETPD